MKGLLSFQKCYFLRLVYMPYWIWSFHFYFSVLVHILEFLMDIACGVKFSYVLITLWVLWFVICLSYLHACCETCFLLLFDNLYGNQFRVFLSNVFYICKFFTYFINFFRQKNTKFGILVTLSYIKVMIAYQNRKK